MRKSLRIALALTGVAIALLVAGGFAWNRWTYRELAAAKARIRAAKLPVTVDEVRPPSLPDDKNAAPLLAKFAILAASEAFKGKSGLNGIEDRLLTYRQRNLEYRLDPADLADLASIFNQPVVIEMLALARQAAGRNGYDAQLAYHDLHMVTRDLGPLRETIFLLSAHARLAASQDRAEDACADVTVMLALAELLAHEPTPIGYLTRCAGLGIALESIEGIASTGNMNDAWSARFIERLRAIVLTTGLLRVLDGDRVLFGAEMFDQMLAGQKNADATFTMMADNPVAQTLLKLKYVPSGIVRLEYMEYLDRMRLVRREVADTSRPYSVQVARLQEIAAAVPPQNVFTRGVMPILTSLVAESQTFGMKLVVATAGLALHRYHLKHGRMPESLEGLVPEFLATAPVDAFTEHPLQFRRVADDRFVIYSVGKNRIDDGGTFAPYTGKDDVVWTYSVAPDKPAPRR